MKHTIAIALCAALLCGCSTVQDIIDGLPDVPPAVTNALPDLPPIVVPPIVQPPASECDCDLSLPRCTEDIRVIYDRVNGEGSHKAAGNNEVCWTAQSGQGYDFRCMFRSTNPRQRHVSSWGRKWGYDVVSRGNLRAKCFRMTLSGTTYQCHYLGYSTEEDQEIEYPDVRDIVCKGRTFAMWAVRVAGKPDAPPPVVVPPVAPPDPVADFTVPPRTGTPSYTGTGVFRSFLTIDGTESPRKGVTMETWVKVNRFVRPEVGASLLNKGLAGSHWAYNLTVRPNAIVYGATKGSVLAPCQIKTGRWYHVRMDVEGSTVRVWLDGKAIPVTTYETTALLAKSGEPLRVGGYLVPLTWNDAVWYNSSLDGEMSDWRVSVR